MCWTEFHSSMSDSLVWKGTEFYLYVGFFFHQPIYTYNLRKLQALPLSSVRHCCWKGIGLLGWMKFGSRPILCINIGCSLYWDGPAWYGDRKLLAPKLFFMLDNIWVGINTTDLTVLLTIKLVPDIKNINYCCDRSGISFLLLTRREKRSTNHALLTNYWAPQYLGCLIWKVWCISCSSKSLYCIRLAMAMVYSFFHSYKFFGFFCCFVFNLNT